MKKVKGQPITGSNIEGSHKRPFVPDAKETSADEQTMIKEPPAPFKSNMTAAQMPTGSTLAQPAMAGQTGQRVGAKGLPNLSATGDRPVRHQAVTGRMGTSFPRKVGNFPGVKAKKRSAFYGE